MHRLRLLVAAALALAALATAPAGRAAESPVPVAANDAPQRLAQAAVSVASCGPERLSFLQRRILQKAEQGPAALRQYIWITRSVFGLDMRESLEFVERHRAERAACGRPA
jgi:hypothetical protein